MTVALDKLSFAEYCAYADGTDRRYELVNGVLMPMSLGTGQHGAIAKFLERAFDEEISRQGQAWTAQKFTVGVQSPRGRRWDTSRIPDVTVLTQEQWDNLAQREAIITLADPPPLLVVEVVSDSTRTTDYRAKQTEYAARDIEEYWIVDSAAQKVVICTLVEGFYDQASFLDQASLVSPTFPGLTLTAQQVLNASL